MPDTFPPSVPDYGSEEFRNNAEEQIQNAFMGAADPEAVVVKSVLKFMVSGSRMQPFLPILKQIYANPEHKIFTEDARNLSPEMRAYTAKMRQKQVGALIHFLNVIEQTRMRQHLEAPRIEKEAEKSAVDRAMESLGIEGV